MLKVSGENALAVANKRDEAARRTFSPSATRLERRFGHSI